MIRAKAWTFLAFLSRRYFIVCLTSHRKSFVVWGGSTSNYYLIFFQSVSGKNEVILVETAKVDFQEFWDTTLYTGGLAIWFHSRAFLLQSGCYLLQLPFAKSIRKLETQSWIGGLIRSRNRNMVFMPHSLAARMADPITKATWDNFYCLPKCCKRMSYHVWR